GVPGIRSARRGSSCRSRLERWLSPAAMSTPLRPNSDEGAAEYAEAEPLGWCEGSLALLEKRTRQHHQPPADDEREAPPVDYGEFEQVKENPQHDRERSCEEKLRAHTIFPSAIPL